MSTLIENLLIPLPGFTLPSDFPWRVRFILAVDEQLKRLRATGHYMPARFFGYFFQGEQAIGVSGSWTVSLDSAPPLGVIPKELMRLTNNQYSITSATRSMLPEFMLIHDRVDGTCWLWRFAYGLRFVEAVEPFEGGGDELGFDDAENRRFFGP